MNDDLFLQELIERVKGLERGFDRLNRLPRGGGGYRAYVASVTQSGTSAPVATVQKDDFEGALEWSRSGVGQYALHSVDSLFTAGKTVVLTTGVGAQNGRVWTYIVGEADIYVRTGSETVDDEDDWLTDWGIEVRVYP